MIQYKLRLYIMKLSLKNMMLMEMRGGKQKQTAYDMMKTVDLVFEKLLELEHEGNKVTTYELATVLDLKRNLVSHYLNQLVEEGRLGKSGSKPVYYFSIQKEEVGLPQEQEMYPFTTMIGYHGSLKGVVENCKAVVNYPVNGLPILLTGSTGVGKSYLAELIYEYAKQQGIIESQAPFIKLNCADYADNKELLSTMLFGHTKNAFTGAESDTEGLINKANKGFLFLDEVHRLSNEGQEKLFQVLDKGEYRKIGDAGKNQVAKVRFIFATSEDPEKVLIRTLRRRIPIITKIPDLKERPTIEKYELITSFYRNESRIFKRPIQLDSHVMNYLLSSHFSGNIGEVANLVKSSCAKAFTGNKNSGILHVDMNALKLNIYETTNGYKEYIKNNIVIDGEKDVEEVSFVDYDHADTFWHFYEMVKQHTNDLSALKKDLYDLYDKSDLKEHELVMNHLLKDMIEIVVEYIKNTYGVNLGMNAPVIVYNLIYSYNLDIYQDRDEEIQELLNTLQQQHAKLYALSDMLISRIEINCGIKVNLPTKLLLCVYILAVNIEDELPFNALLMAHGNSTATSISSVVNRMLESYVFEACDIPFDISYDTFLQITNDYLKKIDKSKPTIILADMGSVSNIYQRLANDLENELLMVNNVSTGVALEIGNRIRNRQQLNVIAESIEESCQIEYKYVSSKKKKKVIVIVCVSGLGAAEVIKEVICEFTDEDVMLITSDYMSIISEGTQHPLFSSYDIQCVVSTNEIRGLDVDCINISEVITNNSKDHTLFINKVLGKKHKNNIDEAKDRIIKTFTLENLVDRLVFLKPEIVIEDVEKIVFDIEVSMKTVYESNVRMMLYLHLAVLIERAILKNCEEDCYKDEQWIQAHNDDICIIKDSFKQVEQKYNIEIPLAEIIYILEVITSV